MKEQITFDYERVSQLEVVRHIEDCEGRHVQQAIYSTFMGTLTQICFTEQKIRGSIYWEGNRSWTQKEIQGINTLEDKEEKKRGQDKHFETIPQLA